MTKRTHELKTWPEEFDAVASGKKRFEWRKEDRGFAIGDIIWLRAWYPVTREYTGPELRMRVTYILRGPRFGVPEGYCIMSLGML